MGQTELTVTICGKDGYIHKNSVFLNTPREISHAYYGLSGSLNNMIHQMQCVQRYFGIEEPMEKLHLVVDYGTLVKDDETASAYNVSCAEYFCQHHQIYCCTYQDIPSLRYYAHILLNPVSYTDGKVFDVNGENMALFCDYLFHLSGIPVKVI
ncbi:MAG: hypothetical protein IKP69_08150 [Oscillospiraceae bacterium]|nr:hypothetical protein [Oscillospiraceae bacterium]